MLFEDLIRELEEHALVGAQGLGGQLLELLIDAAAQVLELCDFPFMRPGLFLAACLRLCVVGSRLTQLGVHGLDARGERRNTCSLGFELCPL